MTTLASIMMAAALHAWGNDDEQWGALFTSVDSPRETFPLRTLGRPEPLSERSRQPDDRKEPPSAAASRGSLVRVDIAQLEAVRKQVEQQRDAQLNLNLSADNLIEAVFDNVQVTQGGYALSGRVPGIPHSSIVFAVRGVVVAGLVHVGDRVWMIESQGSRLHAIRPLTEPVRCSNGLVPENGLFGEATTLATTSDSSPPRSADDDGSVIDVLVMFTTAVRERFGYERIRADIDLAVAAANEAFRAGGAVQRLNLVATVETSYRESSEHGNSNLDTLVDLNRLTRANDGHLEEAHRLRDQYAADIVYLAYAGDSGRAWVLDPSQSSTDEAWKGFAVGRTQPDLVLTFVHELGHVMGLLHERFEGTSEDVYPYAYGYVNQPGLYDDQPDLRRWETIMAYGVQCWTLNLRCMQLLRFSNPDQRYPEPNGDPMGVHGDEHTEASDGPANAVRNLNETREIVANFRQSTERCEFAISENTVVIEAGGGDFELNVTTEGICEWEVSTFAEFLEAEVDSGNGTADITVRVKSNTGGARLGTVAVAGEMLLIKQRGALAFEDVCDRTAHVRNAIVAAVGAESCDSIDEFDLLAVVELDLSNFPASDGGLQFGERDLSGLGQLSVLRAINSGIEELPAGLFGGLANLRRLELWSNGIANLTNGVFAGLANLEFLDLSHNQLGDVSEGAFSDLRALETLKLGQNQVTRIDAASLEGLAQLLELDLSHNEGLAISAGTFRETPVLRSLALVQMGLTAVPAGDLLAGLSNLKALHLEHNAIGSVPEDAFDVMPRLEQLYLSGNEINTLEERAFGGLEELFALYLNGNPLTELPESVFSDKPNLAVLHLESMELTSLPNRVFEGLTNLWRLVLADNDINDLSGVRFPGRNIGVIDLARNELKAIPPGMFDGFISESCYQGDLTLDLSGNPGSPFTLGPRFRREDGGVAARGPASMVLEVPQGVPVPLVLEIEASTGNDEWSFLVEATIPNGTRMSEPFAVHDKGRMTLRVRSTSARPLPITIRGLEVGKGESIALYGFEDHTLETGGRSIVLDLVAAFAKDGMDDDLEFSAESSDDTVAKVSLSGGTLTVYPATGIGDVTVTVTATGRDGFRLTRTFTVTVRPPSEVERGMWHGWRLELLRTLSEKPDGS